MPSQSRVFYNQAPACSRTSSKTLGALTSHTTSCKAHINSSCGLSGSFGCFASTNHLQGRHPTQLPNPYLRITPPACLSNQHTNPSHDPTHQPDPSYEHAHQQGPQHQAPQSPTQETAETLAMLDHLWQKIRHRQVDDLLDYLPDELLDAAIEERKAAKKDIAATLTLKEVLSLHQPVVGFQIDSYGKRHLLYNVPDKVTLLSSIVVRQDKVVHRYTVASKNGEQCTLTIKLELRETFQPQYRGSPRMSRQWRVVSVEGEPALDELPGKPGAAVPPESVVQAQLQALQTSDIATVFAFASPDNQAMTGPLERFCIMLHTAAYRPLIGHLSAMSMERIHVSETMYTEVVAVVSDNTVDDMENIYVWHLRPPGAMLSFEGRVPGRKVFEQPNTDSSSATSCQIMGQAALKCGIRAVTVL